MSSIPSNLGRVPDLLRSQYSLSTINRTNLDIFRIANQLSTGKAILRPSDDSVKAASIAAVQTRIDRAEQLSRNLQVADSSLATLDQALGEAGDLLLEAQSIASEQVSFGSSEGERASQAIVIQSIIDGLYQIANRDSRVGHVFAGSTPNDQPLTAFLGGYRYTGRGPGMTTDLDLNGSIPVTLGGDTLLGNTSSRVRGTSDLDPDLTADSRLANLDGARGIGVQRGVVNFAFDGGTPQSIDLSTAETVDDVIDRVTAAILAYETENELTVLGPGGVSFDGNALTIDVDDAGGTNPALVFSDVGTGTTALDLGLAADDESLAFDAATSDGINLNPRLSWNTPLSSLRGLDDVDLGRIRLRAHGVTRTVDLAGSESLQDIRNRIEASGLGVRVEINAEGTGINVFNEVASSAESALSIEEVEDNDGTASALGIRTLDTATRLSEFNEGRGVRYITGAVDPDSGDPDSSLDIDFTITLGNGGTINVNFGPGDMATVETMLEAINTQAADQLADQGMASSLFTASLATDGNGIVLAQDNTAGGMSDPITIEPRNNSQAAADLGLLGGERSDDGSSIVGDDRAKIRPQNVFSWLIDLRDSLTGNSTSGIGIAGENIGNAVDTLAETRALVGGYANRVGRETDALEDRNVLDASLLSQLQDADFAQAATQLSLLQTQLQAALQTTASISSLSLLNYL